ncbi:MAG: hypothetical protein OEL81_09160 [Nitrosopumilus sp.]|nr:hypothetical protein [Nitrosopumilus sp.]MDH3764544.1 hypothetical protein [Nitrosopumilus sp.]
MIALAKKLIERTRLPSLILNIFNLQQFKIPPKNSSKLTIFPCFGHEFSMLSNEHDIKDKSIGYTRDEIQRILKYCKSMDVVIVYLGASSGI